MKIRTTATVSEITATAEELRQSSTLSDLFYNTLRSVFAGPVVTTAPTKDEDELEEAEEDQEE